MVQRHNSQRSDWISDVDSCWNSANPGSIFWSSERKRRDTIVKKNSCDIWLHSRSEPTTEWTNQWVWTAASSLRTDPGFCQKRKLRPYSLGSSSEESGAGRAKIVSAWKRLITKTNAPTCAIRHCNILILRAGMWQTLYVYRHSKGGDPNGLPASVNIGTISRVGSLFVT